MKLSDTDELISYLNQQRDNAIASSEEWAARYNFEYMLADRLAVAMEKLELTDEAREVLVEWRRARFDAHQLRATKQR